VNSSLTGWVACRDGLSNIRHAERLHFDLNRLTSKYDDATTSLRAVSPIAAEVLGRLDHRPQTLRADVEFATDAIDDHGSRLDVWFEQPIGPSLGEAYVAAELGRLAADITLAGHCETPSAAWR